VQTAASLFVEIESKAETKPENKSKVEHKIADERVLGQAMLVMPVFCCTGL
jgi:hypothetical protein